MAGQGTRGARGRTEAIRSPQTRYQAYLTRKQAEYGSRFSPAGLAPQFVPYFESDERIEVESTYRLSGETYVRRGRVGVTTGWQPVFILLHSRRARGSSDVLTASDRIRRVIPEWRRP